MKKDPHEIASAILGKNPDESIVLEQREVMNAVANVLDGFFNPVKEQKDTCFVLLVAPFGDGRCNYISNGDRKDILAMMKEVIKRNEGAQDSGKK